MSGIKKHCDMSSLPVPSPRLSTPRSIRVTRNTVALKWNNFAECCDFVALMKGALLEFARNSYRHAKEMRTHIHIQTCVRFAERD